MSSIIAAVYSEACLRRIARDHGLDATLPLRELMPLLRDLARRIGGQWLPRYQDPPQ